MPKKLRVPFTPEEARALRAGESVLLSGTVYTARDAAHKRLCELLSEGKELPLDIRNATIYYVGPTPAREGRAIGSAGPTTSYRMDAYSPALIAAGETGMIGKGKRGEEVIAAMKEHGAVYFGAIGGAGALLSRLEVEDFPVTVVIDCEGNNLYEQGRKAYLESVAADEV